MNFKDSYKKDMKNISPDKEFIQNLNVKLQTASKISSAEDEKTEKKKVRFSYWYPVSAAVLLIVFAIGFGTLYIDKKPAGNSQNMGQQGITESIVPTGDTIFNKQKWYKDCETEQDIYNLFVFRISDANDLIKLYKNDDEIFEDSMLMNQEDINSLTEILQRGTIDKDETINVENKKAEYYMAVFENGDIIKFSLYENSILKLREFDFLIFL